MKEDILEQLVDDYYQHLGYFTRSNLKFRPREDHRDFVRIEDSNHSDIDVIALHPTKRGANRVMVISCKSWQSGFDPRAKIQELGQNKVRSGRAPWKAFRELVQPKWSEAFITAIRNATGSDRFTYVTAVTAIKGDRAIWENHTAFRKALGGNPIRLIALREMLEGLLPALSTTVASSQLGRMLQLLKAAGCSVSIDSRAFK